MSRLLVLVVLGAALSAPTLASAAPVFPVRCPLSRSPYLPRGAMADTVACNFDEDGNGLDDEVEMEIARCFVPEFHFDADENALAGGEPLPIFSARPMVDEPEAGTMGQNRVRLKWLFLYGADGGTPEGRSFVDEYGVDGVPIGAWLSGPLVAPYFYKWNTAHEGDTETAELIVTLAHDGRRWSANLVQNSDVNLSASEKDAWWAGRNCQIPRPTAPGEAVALEFSEEPEFNGTHPVVYVAAGKHHPYLHAHAAYCRWNSGDGLVLTYEDRVRGNHPSIPPSAPVDRIQHAPLLVSSGGTHLFFGSMIDGTGKEVFVNVCHAARGVRLPATRLIATELSAFGYPNDRVASGKGFIGDESFAGSPVTVVAGSITSKLAHHIETSDPSNPEHRWWDHDRDGTDNTWGIRGPAPERLDACPWVFELPAAWSVFELAGASAGADVDGDHFPAACDADDLHRSVYVAGGTPGQPVVTDEATAAFARWGSGLPRGGFLDSDRDQIPDGEDGCPLSPGSFLTDVRSNANRAAERKFFSPLVTRLYDPGTLERADRCDPNPVAVPEVVATTTDGGTGIGMCKATRLIVGEDALTIVNTTTRGVSHNGPTPVLGATIAAQTYRCACRTVDGGAIEDATTCLTSPRSECNRWHTTTAAPGHGWIPIHRAGCGADGCARHAVPLAIGASTTSTITWDWRDELTEFGPDSSAPHFAPGEIVSKVVSGATVYESTFDYVFWTQTYPAGSLGVETTTRMPDPERLPAYSYLADPTNATGQSLRAGYSLDTHRLVSRHELPFNLDCPAVDWASGEIPSPVSDPAGWGESVGAVMGPDVIWVELGERARWARTTPSGDILAEGELPAEVSALVRLVPDRYGEGAVMLDPMHDATWRYDAPNDIWTSAAVDVSAVVWQPEWDLQLEGASLVVTEGEWGGWTIDLIGGEMRQ